MPGQWRSAASGPGEPDAVLAQHGLIAVRQSFNDVMDLALRQASITSWKLACGLAMTRLS